MRYADCHGSRICDSKKCPYKIQFGVINRLQFSKDNLCSACGKTSKYVSCPAQRYTYLKGQKLQVFHCGTHTCPVRSKNVEKPAKNVQEILKKDPSLKPSEVQSAMIVPMLRGKNDWEKIDKQVTQLIDRSWISRQKRTVRREINPMGHYGRKFRGVGYV